MFEVSVHILFVLFRWWPVSFWVCSSV